MFLGYFCSSNRSSKQVWQNSSYFSHLHCAMFTYNMAAAIATKSLLPYLYLTSTLWLTCWSFTYIKQSWVMQNLHYTRKCRAPASFSIFSLLICYLNCTFWTPKLINSSLIRNPHICKISRRTSIKFLTFHTARMTHRYHAQNTMHSITYFTGTGD